MSASPKQFGEKFLAATSKPWRVMLIALIPTVLAVIGPLRDAMAKVFEHSTTRIAVVLILVAVAIRFSKHAAVRVGFAVTILGMMIVCAMKYGERFPFESWKLYGRPAPAKDTVYYLEVTTTSGKAYRVDDTVLGKFSSPSNHGRWAERIVKEMSPAEQKQFSMFVVKQVQAYRAQRSEPPSPGKWIGYLAFPPHQFGLRWAPEQLAELANANGIRISTMEVELERSNQWRTRILHTEHTDIPCF